MRFLRLTSRGDYITLLRRGNDVLRIALLVRRIAPTIVPMLTRIDDVDFCSYKSDHNKSSNRTIFSPSTYNGTHGVVSLARCSSERFSFSVERRKKKNGFRAFRSVLVHFFFFQENFIGVGVTHGYVRCTTHTRAMFRVLIPTYVLYTTVVAYVIWLRFFRFVGRARSHRGGANYRSFTVRQIRYSNNNNNTYPRPVVAKKTKNVSTVVLSNASKDGQPVRDRLLFFFSRNFRSSSYERKNVAILDVRSVLREERSLR